MLQLCTQAQALHLGRTGACLNTADARLCTQAHLPDGAEALLIHVSGRR
jgi:hypothetical protein